MQVRAFDPSGARSKWLLQRLTILFGISLFFLMLHVVDDAFNTGEPAEYGVSIPAFLLYAASVYLIVPPAGLFFARRGSLIGLSILTLYGLQAMYGAGLNHVRHMFGDFSGSRLLPEVLAAAGVHITDIRGYGFGSVLMGMAGLGQTPFHTHTLPSSLVAFIDIGVNAVLVGMCVYAFAFFWQGRTTRRASAAADQPSP